MTVKPRIRARNACLRGGTTSATCSDSVVRRGNAEAPRQAPPRGTRPPTANSPPMNAREYFDLLDTITNAATPDGLTALELRLAATAMHLIERRALERVARKRGLDLAVDAAMRSPAL